VKPSRKNTKTISTLKFEKKIGKRTLKRWQKKSQNYLLGNKVKNYGRIRNLTSKKNMSG
jgi:hypothetical protein